MFKETDAEKYDTLRSLIEQKNCPTIVYVSRTRRTREIAKKLACDGFKARPFNGKMDSSEKQANQDAFVNNEVQVMVATSAFGMGVDKSDVGLVVHYDISDSLENYVQEAGRAGRDPSVNADCYVLFNDSDLDKHFMLLNQTKLSISEIQQIWKAVKELTKIRSEICCSPLEIARKAGWDDSVSDIETRVKTAIQALENAGYLKRGKNVPRVYAKSILVKNMKEASEYIEKSHRITSEYERNLSKRIISSLISSRSISKSGNDDSESRIDYIADHLGVEKTDIIHSVQLMREDGLLSDSQDLTAYIMKSDTKNKSLMILHKFKTLEKFLLDYIDEESLCMNYKEINEAALANGIKSSSVNSIKTLFYYWTIRSYIQKEQDLATNRVIIVPKLKLEIMKRNRDKSHRIAEFIVNYLFEHSSYDKVENEEVMVGFSELELMREYEKQGIYDVTANEIEEALLFLSKINSVKLDGGFTVLYNGMQIRRLILDNKIRYKLEDYKQLREFYKQKIHQIHIVGEYANMMVHNYEKALQFVIDYFQMDYKKFISQYFSGERTVQIERNITPQKYSQLFDTLSERQLEIISDDKSQHIVISAGPGSGKTKVLVHKLAALLLLEDIKHEQLLMLTFSRAAAIEFKQRLRELIGNSANFVEIKTFHSYCFDLLGKIGNIQDSENVVKDAGKLILSGDVDPGRITKTVLVIDEAQDMDCYEFQLVEALMERNDDMRVIAVGDDDQNIYQFRGSDSEYMKKLITEHNAKQYSLIENYRSSKSIVSFANIFVKEISGRMKSEDILSVSEFDGETKLIKHNGRYIETSIADDTAALSHNGTICILTDTNKEALLLLGVLKQKNIPAKLIQSIDGFDIYDIAEIRYFMKKLRTEKSEESPVIYNNQWKNAVSMLKQRYGKSECLPMILDILSVFEGSNLVKYRTDFNMFLHESKIEDFYKSEQDVITISTIHKSKGREFDNIIMMLNNPVTDTDEAKRKLYVGFTRAKSVLHIHYTGDYFDAFTDYVSVSENDTNSYKKSSELIIQLSHRDVHLGFFKDKKSLILRMQSGMHLYARENRLYLYSNEKMIPVVQFSKSCYEKIKKIIDNGYKLYDSKVRFICAWKGKEDTEETSHFYFEL